MFGGYGVSKKDFDYLRNHMAIEGRLYSVRFDMAVRRVPCTSFHLRKESKYRRKIYYTEQDDRAYKAYDGKVRSEQ